MVRMSRYFFSPHCSSMSYHYTKNMKVYFFLLVLMKFGPLFSEEIVHIQAVSYEKDHLMISKGAFDGISVGMESVFSNPHFSIVARAIEVNRSNSVWTPVEKKTVLPFQRGDLISFEKDPLAIYHAVSKINNMIVSYKKKSFDEFSRKKNFLLLKGLYGQSLSESTSGVPAENIKGRSSADYEMFYERYINQRFDLLLGIRYQKDVVQTKNPTLETPYARFLFQTEGHYKFNEYNVGKYLYLNFGVGIGT